MTRPSPVLAFVVLSVLAVLAEGVMRALAARIGGLHVWPSPTVSVLAMALLMWPLPAALALALLFGSEAAQASCAPPGVLEASWVLAAATVGMARWRWLGRSPRDVALAAGTLHAVTQASAALLLLAGGRRIGFASWPAAALLPGALLDAGCALALAGPLGWLWRRLTPASPRSLAFGRR